MQFLALLIKCPWGLRLGISNINTYIDSIYMVLLWLLLLLLWPVIWTPHPTPPPPHTSSQWKSECTVVWNQIKHFCWWLSELALIDEMLLYTTGLWKTALLRPVRSSLMRPMYKLHTKLMKRYIFTFELNLYMYASNYSTYCSGLKL